jgi:hypothetical protein
LKIIFLSYLTFINNLSSIAFTDEFFTAQQKKSNDIGDKNKGGGGGQPMLSPRPSIFAHPPKDKLTHTDDKIW